MSRKPGRGSMFLRSDGMWVGSVEAPRPDGRRGQRRVYSKMFCAMLAKFSAVVAELPPDEPALTRREHLIRARKLGTHTRGQWTMQMWRQKNVCHYCGKIPSESGPTLIMGEYRHHMLPLVKDHMTPISRGGSDAMDNIVGACAKCNHEKGRMTAEEYMEYRNATTAT